MNYKCKDCGRDIKEDNGRCDRCMLYQLQMPEELEE